MTQILIDRITTVTLHNGVVRIDCVAAGPNGEERASGTLLIPGNQARAVLQALTSNFDELQKQLRERMGAGSA